MIDYSNKPISNGGMTLSKSYCDYVSGVCSFDEILVNAPILVELKSKSIIITAFRRGDLYKKAERMVSVAIPYQDINYTFLSSEPNVVEEVKSKSVLGRAIVGNLLVPGIGGLIGGMSGIGDKKKSYALSSYLFAINFKNNDGNNSEIVFSFKADNTKESSAIDEFASVFAKVRGFNHFDNTLPDYIIKGFKVTRELTNDEKAVLSNNSINKAKAKPFVAKRDNYKLLLIILIVTFIFMCLLLNGAFV